MPIKSYVVFPMENKKQELQEELNSISGCEVTSAVNKDVLLLLTDTESEQADKALYEQLKEIKNIQMISMVSGFEEIE